MPSLFSHEEVNTGRQLELDLVKAVTIILMVWTHVYEDMSTGFMPSLSAVNAYVRGSVAGASTFMFCMGIGLSYTRHNSAAECLRRGFRLITTGFVLELFRTVIPSIISCLMAGSRTPSSMMVLGLSCDILQFAGLAFILVGLLKKLKIGNAGMLLISLAMSVAGTVLEGVQTGNYAADQLLGFFWGTYSESYFPLFNWFIFVAAGQYFGDRYRHLMDKTRFHTISLLTGSLLCAAYLYVALHCDQHIFKGIMNERFLAHRPFADAIICLPINAALISLFYFIGMAAPRKALPVLIHPSRHITRYFCISWVIIANIRFLPVRIGALSSDAEVLMAWICILAATVTAVVIYSRFLKQKTEAFFGQHRAFWSALVWAACIASFVWALCTYESYPNFLNGYSA